MPPAALPAPALADRFRGGLAALGVGLDARIGLAVSGGPDSLALLLLASAAGLAIEAATVDHGLRPQSAAEAAFVAQVSAGLGIPHATLTLGLPDRSNLSDWARRERYRALGDWADRRGLRWIATAHHADDQLETMLMRLNRGSGVGGLAGIRARNGRILRPLLGWRRAELAAIVRDAGIDPVDDPSNRDDRFDRARLRKALRDADWLDPLAAARSAAAFADAEEALDWAARDAAERRLSRDGAALRFDPSGLPHEIVRRILLACLASFGAPAPRGEAAERAIAALRSGRAVTLAGVKCTPGAVWTFAPAPPRRASTRGSS